LRKHEVETTLKMKRIIGVSGGAYTNRAGRRCVAASTIKAEYTVSTLRDSISATFQAFVIVSMSTHSDNDGFQIYMKAKLRMGPPHRS
jgi:hypothetical protein